MEEKEIILIFADTHLFAKADSNQKEKEEKLPIGEKMLLWISYRLFKPDKDKDKLHWESFQNMIRKIRELKKSGISFERVIDLGDATFGSYNQGLISPEAVRERVIYNQIIKDNFPKTRKYFVWGNHDLGFQNSFTKIFNLGYWSKGISKHSFEVAEELIGPAWRLFKVKDFNFLILNSEIIRAVNTIDSIKPSERDFFIEKEKEQRIFIEKSLKEPGLFILIIHDPNQLKFLWPILKNHVSKISLTLAGHCHFATSEKILKKRSRIYSELNLKIIPSPWFWNNKFIRKFANKERGGFASLEVSENSLKLNHYWL